MKSNKPKIYYEEQINFRIFYFTFGKWNFFQDQRYVEQRFNGDDRKSLFIKFNIFSDSMFM